MVLASQMVDLDDFVEMTKKYAQGIVPSTSQTDSQVEAKTESPYTPNDRREEVKDHISKNKKLCVIIKTQVTLYV